MFFAAVNASILGIFPASIVVLALAGIMLLWIFLALISLAFSTSGARKGAGFEKIIFIILLAAIGLGIPSFLSIDSVIGQGLLIALGIFFIAASFHKEE